VGGDKGSKEGYSPVKKFKWWGKSPEKSGAKEREDLAGETGGKNQSYAECE